MLPIGYERNSGQLIMGTQEMRPSLVALGIQEVMETSSDDVSFAHWWKFAKAPGIRNRIVVNVVPSVLDRICNSPHINTLKYLFESLMASIGIVFAPARTCRHGRCKLKPQGH